MSANKLHIISFDVPDPPDYGGAIDVYYKIKSLAEAGVEIYLHCFEYGRPASQKLAHMCKEVWYYPRLTGIRGVSPLFPYIVYSRRGKDLLNRLVAIDAPILFEGVHTTYFLKHPALKKRYKMVRVHNVEHEYYGELAKKENAFLKRTYFSLESNLLRGYEQTLSAAQAFITMTEEDGRFFWQQYPGKAHKCIRAFHPFDNVTSQIGIGDYCLYHGNLGHPENEEAVLFLLGEVFNSVDIPLVVAGRNPSQAIIETVNKLAHVKLIANPTTDELSKLILNAHVNVLPTFQATGLKLKLLYALFVGRHALVNKAILHGTGLADCCRIAETASEFRIQLSVLMQLPFGEEDILGRRKVLEEQYNNTKNAQRIIKLPVR